MPPDREVAPALHTVAGRAASLLLTGADVSARGADARWAE